MDKKCPKCKENKPLAEFSKNHGWCKVCKATAQREYNKKNKEKRRLYLVEKNYGLSSLDLELMYKRQGSRCAICGIHEDDCNGRLHIDHCHTIGHVRALLCSHCNVGLGQFRDNPELLERAAEYVRENDRREQKEDRTSSKEEESRREAKGPGNNTQRVQDEDVKQSEVQKGTR